MKLALTSTKRTLFFWLYISLIARPEDALTVLLGCFSARSNQEQSGNARDKPEDHRPRGGPRFRPEVQGARRAYLSPSKITAASVSHSKRCTRVFVEMLSCLSFRPTVLLVGRRPKAYFFGRASIRRRIGPELPFSWKFS